MHFVKLVRQYDKPQKFTDKPKYEPYEHYWYMDFSGVHGCYKGELIKQRKPGWVYQTPNCDPGQTPRWTAKQLRQIADKLDELNGEQQ